MVEEMYRLAYDNAEAIFFCRSPGTKAVYMVRAKSLERAFRYHEEHEKVGGIDENRVLFAFVLP